MFRRGIMVLLALVLGLMTAAVALADEGSVLIVEGPGGGNLVQPYNNEWSG